MERRVSHYIITHTVASVELVFTCCDQLLKLGTSCFFRSDGFEIFLKPWPNGLAGSRNLNWRRELRWVDKRTRNFPHNKNHFKAHIFSNSLANRLL